MSTKYKVRNTDNAHFITITTVKWVDLFTRLEQKKNIIESLEYCQKNKGLEIYAFVIMPSHIHLMCRSTGEVSLNDIMRDFKKFTAKKIIQSIKEGTESRREWLLEIFAESCAHLKRDQQYKVWQDGYHAEELQSNKFIYQKLNYIHQNPVADGIVERAEEYYYSSARNYADLNGVLDIVVLPQKLITF
jgi:REP element-mobilizing transposase RayT